MPTAQSTTTYWSSIGNNRTPYATEAIACRCLANSICTCDRSTRLRLIAVNARSCLASGTRSDCRNRKRIQQSSTAWDKAKQRAGIEDFRFHDLRHTWASWHVQSGTSLPELMELGGWKSYEMVLRYAHLAPEKLSSVAGRIERQALTLAANATLRENVAKNATLALRSVH